MRRGRRWRDIHASSEKPWGAFDGHLQCRRLNSSPELFLLSSVQFLYHLSCRPLLYTSLPSYAPGQSTKSDLHPSHIKPSNGDSRRLYISSHLNSPWSAQVVSSSSVCDSVTPVTFPPKRRVFRDHLLLATTSAHHHSSPAFPTSRYNVS
ncbi:hypothetical protein IWZ03DRAFT_364179 [Phyllosticta citriasiana]|uniref:Uncharacterized protein n=1 Tax=Phyllosticta citriasiana TaxID=595635 RepID=A0ABR1KXE8_9PEZI